MPSILHVDALVKRFNHFICHILVRCAVTFKVDTVYLHYKCICMFLYGQHQIRVKLLTPIVNRLKNHAYPIVDLFCCPNRLNKCY